jgi:hypothetical protein
LTKNTAITTKVYLLTAVIIFYASISQERIDPSFGTNAIDNLTFRKIRRDLFPVLKQEERRQTFNLEYRKKTAT